MTRTALVLAAILTCNVALAEAISPPPTPAAAQRAQTRERRETLTLWWLWSVAAVLSAGVIVTTVVVATGPHGSLNAGPNVGAGAMGLTVRF